MRNSFIFSILVLLLTSYAHGKLPADAQRVVDSLPDKALTMELILAIGAKSAESFKEVESQYLLIPASELSGEAAFTPQFTASATHSDDRSEPTNTTTSTKSAVARVYDMGVSKYFSSGTGLELKFTHTDADLEYFGTPSAFSTPSYYESELSLGLTQSLLKDPLGYSSRRTLKASKLLSEAQKHRADAGLEEWTRQISNLYYAAWQAKKNLLIADDALKRRNQLLKTTRLKAKRGTSEKPDLLQVESVQLLAVNQKAQAEQELNNHWRNLILSLKLPAEWIQVDPRFVPIKLDNPISKAEAQCKSFRKKGVPKSESAVVRMNQAISESANLLAEARKKEMLPELNLVGSVAYNAIDNTNSTDTISDATNGENPAWTLGLNLTIPFSFDSEKASYLQAYSDQVRNTSQYNSAKDDLRVAWMNDCSGLDSLLESNKRAKIAFNKQRQRERLERKRFGLGRIPVFNYIQAGDDAAEAERAYSQQQVMLRQLSWQILRNASQINDIMKKLREDYEKNN